MRLNGRLVADQRFDGLTNWSYTLDDPGSLLASGNHLEIELPFDTGYAFDLVHFEGFTVGYKRGLVAHGGLLEGNATNRVPVAATGFAAAPSLWSEGGRARAPAERRPGLPAGDERRLQPGRAGRAVAAGGARRDPGQGRGGRGRLPDRHPPGASPARSATCCRSSRPAATSRWW